MIWKYLTEFYIFSCLGTIHECDGRQGYHRQITKIFQSHIVVPHSH